MRINKYLYGMMIAVTAMFASCSTDNEGAIYDIASSGNGEGITFSTSNMGSVTVTPTDPTFEVFLFRGNTKGEFTGSLEATGTIGEEDASDVFTVSDFAFADGEASTSVTVNVENLEVGKVLALKLAFKDEANLGVSKIDEISMKVNKDYEWISLGNCTFVDAWATGSDANPDGVATHPEILKADGFDLYRVVDPYVEYLKSDAGAADWDSWLSINTSVHYLDLNIVENGGIKYVLYDDYLLGLNYQGDKDQPIYGCHPSGWSKYQSPETWVHNVMKGSVIQLAPFYYIDGVGGWDYSQYDGVVTITLPE